MRFLPLAVVVFVFGAPASSMAQAVEPAPGPPPPLAGVPVDFRCDAQVGPTHPLLDRHTGQDLHDLARGDVEDPAELADWLDDHLCGLVWAQMERAGAHLSPVDVRLPARAVLDVQLVSASLEGTRTVEQRIGSTVMPVAVPHWALAVHWTVSFDIEYAHDGDVMVRTTPLNLNRTAGAEQEDYTPLRLGALLRASTLGAFRDLPRILSDEGRLGDLLFAVVERPPASPDELGVSGQLSTGFWNLMVPRATHRHDALAFYLSSERVPEEARVGLARWFLLNDSDLGLRRDALAWLLSRSAPADAERDLEPDLAGLLHWLLARDKSPRMRAEVATALSDRTGTAVRDLLLIASADRDRRVSDVANGALRRFEPPTAAEMQAVDLAPAPPSLARWTIALDGRVPLPPGNPDRFLLSLATAAGGPAAETWTSKWLTYGALADDDVEWALQAWEVLAGSPSRRIREQTLDRLSRELTLLEVEAIIIDRVRLEEDPVLRVAAIEALETPGSPGVVDALIEATKADESKVRAAAALALGRVPGRTSRGRLEVMVRSDPDGKVRRKAKRALRAHDRLGG